MVCVGIALGELKWCWLSQGVKIPKASNRMMNAKLLGNEQAEDGMEKGQGSPVRAQIGSGRYGFYVVSY